MRCRVLATLSPLVIALFGCATIPSVRITGIVAESSVGGNYAFADFDENFFNQDSLRKRARPFRKLSTTQNLKLEITQQWQGVFHDFFVVLGPTPGTNEVAAGVVVNPEVSFKVKEGYGYASGDNPRVKTEWVSTSAEGTQVVMHIEDLDTHTIYLPASNNATASATVTCNSGPGDITFANTGALGWFVRVDDTCTFTGPIQISADVDAQAFINAITPIVTEAQ